MAKNRVDTAAAKAKKQMIILAVGGVLLLVLAAIQVPKLMGGGEEQAAAPTAGVSVESPVSTTTPAVTPAATPAATPLPAQPATFGKAAAVVAGVPLPAVTRARATSSQLASFTLFEVKDPFVPGVDESLSPGGAAVGEAGRAQAAAGNKGAADGGSPAAADGGSPAADGGSPAKAPDSGAAKPAPPPPVVYATIDLDGKPQQVGVKGKFPASNPLFVLRSLKKKQATIGVAGGSFDDGQAVTLQFGKKMTLVNTATGVRYVLKLVYTGAEPEALESFTQDEARQSDGSGEAADQTATTSGTTTGSE